MALGFGETAPQARATAKASLKSAFGTTRAAYDRGWDRYLKAHRSVPKSAARWRTEWNVSAMVLAASEDKTYRGGFVASPGRPWAWANKLQDLAVYHAVWSRDLYQIATGMLAIGDNAAANRMLDYLWTYQQKTDGSFPQNSRLDGTKVFGDLQMDEVAFPIVLAHQLGRTGAADWARSSARRTSSSPTARTTPQERWENIGGYSPATIAAEIAGLVCAADIAAKNGDAASAATYRATADSWADKVESWTATTTGPYSSAPYYLRVTKNGDPDVGTEIQISDGGPLIDQRHVVDPSFLDLVRLGVKPAGDSTIRSSLTVVDDQLGYRTDNGPFWHRASFDGYGERPTGTQWEPVPTGLGGDLRARLAAAGRRARGVRAAGRQQAVRADLAGDDGAVGRRRQQLHVGAGLGQAVSVRCGQAFTPGEPTMAAMPLAWTHAQFLRLAAGIAAGAPVETPQVVACRYGSEACKS